MPKDTTLEFWITEDVKDRDWTGHDEIYGWMGAREFLGSGYKKTQDEDGSDTFAQDDFYSPELTVTKYTFKISGVDTEKYKASDVAFDVPQGVGSYRIYFPEQNGAHTQDNKEMRIGTNVQKNEREFDLYVFGTPFTVMPEWKAYENGSVEDDKVIACSVDLVGTETLTFKEFVLSNWDEASGVSDVDWYNAALAEITDDNNHYDNYPIAEP